jgi:hypothetical protein
VTTVQIRNDLPESQSSICFDFADIKYKNWIFSETVYINEIYMLYSP